MLKLNCCMHPSIPQQGSLCKLPEDIERTNLDAAHQTHSTAVMLSSRAGPRGCSMFMNIALVEVSP